MPLTLFVGWILFAVCQGFIVSIIVPLIRHCQIRVLERLQKISHLYQMILLPFWQSVHEVRHSQTIIKRKFKMDSRVRTFNEPWLVTISIKTKLWYYW